MTHPHSIFGLLALVVLTGAACVVVESPNADDDIDAAGGGEATGGADDAIGTGADGSGDDGTDGGAAGSTGGSGDGTADGSGDGSMAGYPAEVLDVLDLPFPPDDYTHPDLPAHFTTAVVNGQDNTPADDPITDEGATLGRVLFYDPALSANDTTSCASCHAQSLGFSDDVAFSVGFAGELTGRNSMGFVNARFYAPGHFFWDERAETLEDQTLMPIQSEVEMGLTLDELVTKVQARPYYADLFARAFGDTEVTPDRISHALSQFIRSIVSYQTRYDEGLEQAGSITADFPSFSPQENLGKQLFVGPAGGCGVCHLAAATPPPPPGAPPPNQAIFMLTDAANNGLDLVTDADEGAGDGKFKSPSLRNVELTAPYMHDGRFDTLAQVVEHYDSGVQPHPSLDPRLRAPDGTPRRLELDANEKAALVAFLRTLTDETVLDDPRFSDPFR